MAEISINNKRIAKNALLLYFRMLLLMLISLYTSRVILNALGVDDYGIYNVVGGVVSMFSVLSGSLSAAIGRFLTFELGKGDKEKLRKVFSSSVTIQAGIAFLILVLAETVGLWFINVKMVIPADRIGSANWCFQFSIITFCINLISVPYNAAIIAHERMSAFAYISIFEAIGKLLIAWSIVISPTDRLVFYAAMVAVLACFVRFIYGLYCKRHFQECTYHFVYDNQLLKQMFFFAGWNFVGASAGILRTQGLNVLLNLFFGTIVNAARGISVQINHAVAGFVSNFMTALNPQITKSYATGDYKYMSSLLYKGSRFSFYLLLLLSLPIIVETKTILELWLKIVPEYTIILTRLILVFTMCEAISGPLITAMLATGNIKKYQIIVGGTNLLNLPISYILLKWVRFNNSPEITMYVVILLSVVCLVQRLFLLKDMIELDIKAFCIKVLFNVLIVTFLSSLFPIVFHVFSPIGILSSLINIILCVISCIFVIYYIGCDKNERNLAKSKVVSLVKKNKFWR